MALSLKEALARRGVPKVASSARFGTPIRLRLRMNAEIDRPVDVARLLVSQGVSLKRAHAFLQRIAAGDTVAAQMWSEDSGALVARFSDLGIEAVELRIPDVSPKEIRTRMNCPRRISRRHSDSSSIRCRTGIRAATGPTPPRASCSRSSRAIPPSWKPCSPNGTTPESSRTERCSGNVALTNHPLHAYPPTLARLPRRSPRVSRSQHRSIGVADDLNKKTVQAR